MKVYYNQETDEIYLFFGKSKIPYFARYQYDIHSFTSLKPRYLIYIGEL